MKKIKKTVSAAMITVLLFIGNLYSQAQWSTGGNNLIGLEWLGSDGSSSGPVEIKSLETGPGYNINFWTNGNHNMSLLPSGDLELTNAANGFWINTNPVLWHNGITSNIYVGVGAGNASAAGVNNTFVGFNSGNSNTTGISNTFTGRDAGFSNTTGNNNIAVGVSSGLANTTGSNNTYIGHEADANAPNLTNATAIGANARVDASNSMVLGSINGINGATANTNVGIGTTAPAYTLQVNGTVAATQFLVVDKTQTKDLLALITDLQKEVEELKQKVFAITNN